MQELLAERGIAFRVALYPDEFQVNSSLFVAVCEAFSLDASDFDLDLPHRLLKEFLVDRGIAQIDLLPRLKTYSQSLPLYLERDTHWNFLGNAVLASLLFEDLRPCIRQETSGH